MALSPLNQRRLRNFRANRRAVWSLVIFSVLYILSLGAELIANDKPLLVKYDGGYYTPFLTFYPETAFGGDFQTEAEYGDIEVRCLIVSAGSETCFDDPEGVYAEARDKGTVAGQPVNQGWILSAPIPYGHNTINDDLTGGTAPSPPDGRHLLGTDDTARDVAARIIHGFRLSVTFGLIVTLAASVIGIAAGAVQGYFGGIVDLVFQRLLEIWGSSPQLYIIIIVGALFQMSFWLLVAIMIAFGWTALVGVVRAEFLRARNFEYVRAARALGVSNARIITRHVLPNAMVATLTYLPFIMTGTIGTLAGLDYLGFGLPDSYPSLGELALQAKQNLQAPWLAISAFLTYAIMLSLLVFIFEGVRDAFDPRKTFQ
jgi:microcin C transport system permease protein